VSYRDLKDGRARARRYYREPRAQPRRSGFGENFDRQRLVAERKRKNSRASGGAGAAGAIPIFGRLEEGRSAFVAADAPCSAATTDECPDGELTTRGSILNVAVREAQQKDRRCRDTYTVLRLSIDALLGVSRIETRST